MDFDRTIFVTGFPGFIAERLIERLAAADRQFFLLVQSDLVEKAMESVQAIVSRTKVPIENFALIEGDITLPGLGMPQADAEVVREESTDVFHLAAIYDLAVSEEAAKRVNVEGTQNVNSLVASMPNLRRYSYISTCYVAGVRPGRIFENELEHGSGFRNHYEESKYLAELEVEKLKETLPVTIFRPSVVVGDSSTGETVKYDGIYYLIKYLMRAPGLLRLINVGNDQVRLNLVPVDFVVDSIAALAFDGEAERRTIALADPDPLTTAELFDVLAKELSGKPSAVAPPAAIVERALMLPVSPPVTGLPLHAVPYFFLSQTYDTAAADKLLEKHGISCPNFAQYAGNLIDFVAKHPEL